MTTLENLITSIDERLEKALASSQITNKPIHSEPQEVLEKFVLVRIGSLRFALPIDALSEVGPLPSVTRLPNLPSWIEGIVNLRSEIISVINIQAFLQLRPEQTRPGDRLVVLSHENVKVGLRVDQIVATVTRLMSEVKEMQMTSWQEHTPELFSQGFVIDGDSFHIITPQRFLTMPKLIQYHTIQ